MTRTEYDAIISAVGTFFGVLFIVLFAIAVTSGGALKGSDAFALRWTVIFLAVAFSAVAAWLHWKMLLRRKISSASTRPVSQPPAVIPADPSAAIQAAAKQAIVFRQDFPPRHDESALCFFGGAPIAPRGFRWPRPDESAQTKPFSFLMQIDCAAVPTAARRWPQSAEDCPKLLPKWTFQPVAIGIPSAGNDSNDQDDDPDAPLLWPGEKLTTEPLQVAQGAEVLSSPFLGEDVIDRNGALRRPFPHYPHDWRTIQILSGLLLHRVRPGRPLPSAAALQELSEGDRDALVTGTRNEAGSWYTRAAAQPPFAAVPQAESDRFWSWLVDKTWLVSFVIGEAVTMSIEASLCDSPVAAERIPADVAGRVHGRHALAVRFKDRHVASTPDRMLAPPVDVQGHQWDRAKTHLLLLELSTDHGLGHHFGEGVYQFWITPADLKARRFDKVMLTADAY